MNKGYLLINLTRIIQEETILNKERNAGKERDEIIEDDEKEDQTLK